MSDETAWESSELSENSILEVLDAETHGEWPIFRSEEVRLAYHALRLVVLRKPPGPQGDGYAIVLENLVGGSAKELRLLRTIISPSGGVLASDTGDAKLHLESPWDPMGENVIVGPAGEVTVTGNDLRALEPKRATVGVQEDMLFTLLVRAYLEAAPAGFWPSIDALRWRLAPDFQLEGYALFLESTSFQHVVGTTWVGEPDGIDAAWRKLPSESSVYRSLAKAIVAGNPHLFEPGESNLSWRMHLDAPKASRRLR